MKRFTAKRIVSLCLALLVLFAALPLSAFSVLAAEIQPQAEGLTGYAHSATNSSGDVFLGGQYMEIGISTHGSFGTLSSPPSGSGFYNNKQIGMLIDGDGWGTGGAPTTGDFFLPGTPEERYIFAYYVNGTRYEFPIADRMSLSLNNWKTLPKVVDASYGNTLCAVVTGVTVHDVELKITYSFKDNDKAYSTKFEITNKGSYNITDVRFVRSFDPDQDATKYSEYNTYNKVISNPTTSLPGSDTNYAMVVARGARTKEGFFFIAFDNRARVSRGVEFSLSSAYKSGIWIENTGDPTYATESNLNSLGTNEDSNIAIAFNLGAIYSGGYDSGIYYSSLSPDVNSSLEEVIKPRPPVLSSITGAELPHGYSEGAVSVNASAEAGHELSYQWYKSTSPTNEGGVLIDGATSPSYSLPKGHLAGTEEYYYCVITSTRTDNGLFEVLTTDPITVKYLDGEHDFVTTETKASTCTENGALLHSCTECAKTVTESVAALGHVYEATSTVAPTCTKDGYILYECTREGCNEYKKQTIASPGHELVNNACTKCDYRVPVVHTHSYTTTVVDPTCTEMGYTLVSCNCGYSYRSDYIEQKGHRWDEGTVTTPNSCTVDGVMTYECAFCDASKTEIIPRGHSFTEETVKAATCTEDGEVRRACSSCGVIEIETVKANHKWVDLTVDVKPSCTEGGTKTSYCEVCGLTETFEVDATGHIFTDGVCTVCGMKFIEAVTPDPDHELYGMFFEIDEIVSRYGSEIINEYGLLLDVNEDAVIKRVAVYLVQDGTMWRRCIAVVGEGITYANYVPYLSHGDDIKYTGLNSDMINVFPLSENADGIWTYSNYVTIGANLEDKDGNLLLSLYDIGQAGKNTRIFDNLEEMIAWLSEEAHVHSYETTVIEPTCSTDGFTVFKCAECGYEYVGDVTRASHTESDWIIDELPSCDKSGRKHTVCTVCDQLVHESYITALGHTYKSELVQKATCTEAGIITHTCTRCEGSYSTYIHAEHNYFLERTETPTCTEDGKRIFTCAVCYSSYEETIPGAHEYVSAITKVATAEQDGEITYTCAACGDSYVTVIPARPDASILLIEDTLPWNGSDNVQLLNSLVRDGYLVGWDAATVAELPMINLSDYSIVYIANDQTTATYEELARFNETLTAFVMSGGTVIYGACDEGWSAGHLTSALPGGVMSDNYYSNHNYIVDAEHDVITGTLTDGNALTNALLYGNYCSHTSFVKETLPEGARILIEDAHGNPTLVEYNLGAGTVIATGLTWEFYYNRPAYDSSMNTTYSKTVFDDLIVYAIHASNPCDHAFSEDAIECYPTCTEKGFMAYECTKCGILKKDAFIDALGHTEGEWQVVEDASEIAPGKKVLTCLTCGEVIKTQLIPMIGAPVVRVEAEKDSVALGEQIKFTLNIEDGVVVDKLVLSFDFDKYVFELTDVSWLVDGDVSVDSTTGEITLTLSEPRVLSGVLEFSLRAKTMAESFNVNVKTSMSLGDAAIGATVLGEDLKVNPCTHTNATFKFVNFAYHGVVCKTCGATSLSAHEYSEAYVYLVSPANCVSGDVYAYGCACGDHGDYTFTVGEPIGHVFGEYVYDNNATYTEDGTSTATCPGCGLKDTIVIEGTALGLVRKYLDMVGIALAEDRGMTDKYEAIVAAIQTYELLSEEEKLEVETAHERLYDAIAAYNEQAVVVNKEHVEATEFALTVFSGAFALLPALLWFVKKRFMI